MATAAGAIVLGGFVGPLVLIGGAVIVPAALAGVLGRLLRVTVLLSLPLSISAVIVNVFFFPGGTTVLVQVGPIRATADGVTFALEVLLRVVAFSGAISLFYLTTRPSALVVDFERRGVSSRVTFVTISTVQAVPAMVARAATIIAAQRARGLDTEGTIRRRISGIVPIVGPVIFGAIGDVEERTMALEARGFTRPGRRTLLWAPPDSGRQRLVRWLFVLALIVLIAARAAGLVR